MCVYLQADEQAEAEEAQRGPTGGTQPWDIKGGIVNGVTRGGGRILINFIKILRYRRMGGKRIDGANNSIR